MLLLGVVGGLLGSCFIVLNARLVAWRRKHLARYGVRGRLLEGAVISLITSAVSFTLPLVFACQVRRRQRRAAPRRLRASVHAPPRLTCDMCDCRC